MSGSGPALSLSVNGEPRAMPAGSTVADLLATLGASVVACGSAGGSSGAPDGAPRYAVEINREIVPRSRHGEHRLADGDRVEIVTFVGGG